jgi:oxalate decarboxylase/phosphoglucose isomerase-like protein (cupin superfamily)
MDSAAAVFLLITSCYSSGVPAADQKNPVSPYGTVPDSFSFELSKVKPLETSGGSVRIVDSTTFKVSTTIAAAEVTVEPGAMRWVLNPIFHQK